MEKLAGKKHSYIKITKSGIDLQWTEHIFIEPDSNGNWEVNVREVVDHFIPKHTGVFKSKGKIELSEDEGKRVRLVNKIM